MPLSYRCMVSRCAFKVNTTRRISHVLETGQGVYENCWQPCTVAGLDPAADEGACLLRVGVRGRAATLAWANEHPRAMWSDWQDAMAPCVLLSTPKAVNNMRMLGACLAAQARSCQTHAHGMLQCTEEERIGAHPAAADDLLTGDCVLRELPELGEDSKLVVLRLVLCMACMHTHSCTPLGTKTPTYSLLAQKPDIIIDI